MPSPTIPTALPSTVDSMTDVAYRRYLQDLGAAALHCRGRFLAELPEVARRDLAPRWGHGSVYEFAAKVAGIRRGVVDEILRLHEAVGRYKRLWNPLREGVVGWTKLKTIRKWVTPETVRWWARKLRECSKRQLEDEVRRLEAAAETGEVEQASGQAAGGSGAAPPKGDELPGQGHLRLAGAASRLGRGPAGGENSVPGRAGKPHPEVVSDSGGGPRSALRQTAPQPRAPRVMVHPSHEEMALLEALKAQLEQKEGRTFSYDQVLRRALRQAVSGQQATDEQAAAPMKKSPDPARPPIHALLVLYRNVDSGELRIPTRQGLEVVDGEACELVAGEARVAYLPDLIEEAAAVEAKPGSRYVPVSHQLLVAARYGNRCAFPGCLERAAEVHHVQPIAEGGLSEAGNLAPTCAVHHDAVHSGWVERQRGDSGEWAYTAPGVEPPVIGATDLARQRFKRGLR